MARILLAEDDPLMSRMYERALRMHGHEVVIAADGEGALAVARQMSPPPDAVLLDVMMPKLSGFDVLKEMKTDTALAAIPVILLTNLAGEQDKEQGMALGAVAYLVKSQFDPKQIVARTEEVISAKNR